MKILNEILNSILNFLLPRGCLICNQEIPLGVLCNNCLDSIPIISSALCKVCGRPIQKGVVCRFCKGEIFLDRGRAWTLFIPPVDKIIHQFKYRKWTKLAGLFGSGMVQVLKADFYLKRSEIIAPVPLFWWKKLRRGYNQARLLADFIGRECNIEVVEALSRNKNTKTQTRLKDRERKENVWSAFNVRDDLVKDRIVLLVDDVMTSGATIKECARVLKQSGAKKVYALVAAITPG